LARGSVDLWKAPLDDGRSPGMVRGTPTSNGDWDVGANMTEVDKPMIAFTVHKVKKSATFCVPRPSFRPSTGEG
jgi:hypothetical protein